MRRSIRKPANMPATRAKKSRNATPLSSEAYFRPLVENASDVISIQGADGVIRYISPSVEKALGYAPAEVIGRAIFEFVHPDDLATAVSAFEHRLKTPGAARAASEMRCRHRDGSWRTFQVVGNNCLDHPSIAGIVINLRDITEHKLAERALLASEARLRQITDNMLDVVSQVDLVGTHLYASPSFKKVLGYDPQAMVGTPIYDYVHPDDMAHVLTTIQTAIETRTGAFIEFRFRHSAGHYVWLETTGNFLFDATGELQGAVLAARDVTARRRRERELEAIAAVTASLRVAPARAEMIPVVLDHIQSLLQAEGVALALRDALTGDVLIEKACGQFVSATGKRIPPGEGMISRVIATGKLCVGDSHSPSPVEIDLPDHVQVLVCAPLSARTQTIGALIVGRAQPIGDAEIRLLTAIADIAANAIYRATLHEQTESRMNRLDALATINKAISSSLDLGVTLTILLDQVTLQLRVDAAAVLLLNRHTQTLQYLQGRGLQNNALARMPFGLSEDCAGRVVFERAPLVVPDLANATGAFPVRRLAGENFRAYLAIPLIAKGQVKGVLEIFHRAPLTLDAEWMDFLNTLARDAAIAIDNIELFQGLQQSNSNLMLSYDATLEGWSRALDLRDSVTEGHTQRVVGLTMRLARALQLAEEEFPNLRRGAVLHDIGKIGVPDAILRKPAALVGAEWDIMRKHPVYAYEMLSPIAFLRPALDIPYCHHEHWDGGGYPRGLRGEEIPLSARLFSIVDVWDALRSDRPYRKALPADQVREYIHASANVLFDPKLVDKFLEMVAEE